MVQKSGDHQLTISVQLTIYKGFLHPKRWVGLGMVSHPADTILPGERAAHPAPTLVMKVGANGVASVATLNMAANLLGTTVTHPQPQPVECLKMMIFPNLPKVGYVFLSWRVNFTQVLLRSFGYLWWVYSLYKWCTCQKSAWNVPSFVDLAGRKLQCPILM